MRPQGGASENTVYDAITQIGQIFNVPYEAKTLIESMKNDFNTAERLKLAREASGHAVLRAVWLDCVSCCGEPWEDEYGITNRGLFVGGGTGAPNLIMEVRRVSK